MEPWAITTITVMILLIFAATAIATLLDVYGVRRLPEDYRKPLFGALILEVVSLVIFQASVAPKPNENSVSTPQVVSDSGSRRGDAGGIGETGKNDENTTDSSDVANIDTNSKSGAPVMPLSTNLPSTDPAPQPAPPTAPGAAVGPASKPAIDPVMAWANANLGTKPPGAKLLKADYPACANIVLQREEPFPKYLTNSAYACSQDFLAYRSDYITPYFDAKQVYDSKLERFDEELRDRLDDESIAKRRYIKAEKDRLNNVETGELIDANALAVKSLKQHCDCFYNNCQPTDEVYEQLKVCVKPALEQ